MVTFGKRDWKVWSGIPMRPRGCAGEMRTGLRRGGRCAILGAQFPRLILRGPLLGQGVRDALFTSDGLVVRRDHRGTLHDCVGRTDDTARTIDGSSGRF